MPPIVARSRSHEYSLLDGRYRRTLEKRKEFDSLQRHANHKMDSARRAELHRQAQAKRTGMRFRPPR